MYVQCACIDMLLAQPRSGAKGTASHLVPLPLCMQALRQMGLEGVLVMDVPPGTPADKAGMQVGSCCGCVPEMCTLVLLPQAC